jgi:4-amino-4-deoxy-L-arabinose transferase-like glycosyltransferase
MIYIKKNYIFVLFLFIVLSLLFISSFSPIITRGEGREGLIVKSLSWGESFILPLRHGTEIPSKPPLFHWIGYGLSVITGEVGPLEIRAGSAVGTVVLLVGTYLFFTAHAGSLLGLLTTLILFSSLEVLRYSTQARVDPLFAGVFSAAVYCMFSFYVGKGSQLLTAFGSLLFLVLAVLAKGPFGLILPAAVLVLYLFAKWEVPDSRVLLKGLVIFIFALLLSSIWYFLAYKVGGDRFLDVQLLKENAYRVVKAEGDERGHEKPFYFSFIYLCLAFIPWSLFLPRVVSGMIAIKKEGEIRNSKILLFSLAWVVLFIFAVIGSVSKRSVYFLPALAPLSYIFVISFIKTQSLVLNSWIIKYEKILANLLRFLLIILSVLILFALFSPYSLSLLKVVSDKSLFDRISELVGLQSQASLVMLFIVVLFSYREFAIGFYSLHNERVEKALLEISIGLVFLFYGAQVLVVSRVMALESPKEFMIESSLLLPPKNNGLLNQVVQYKNEYYAPAFYLDRQLPVINSIQDLTQCVIDECTYETFIYVSEKDLHEFENIAFTELVRSKENLANRGERLVLIKLKTNVNYNQ